MLVPVESEIHFVVRDVSFGWFGLTRMLGKVVVLSDLAGLVQSLVESMPKFG